MKTTYILGIDPGITNTGIAILELTGDEVKLISHETLHTEPADSVPGRLRAIAEKAGSLLTSTDYEWNKIQREDLSWTDVVLAIEWKQKRDTVRYATGIWFGAFATCEWFAYTADEWQSQMLAGIVAANTKAQAMVRVTLDYPHMLKPNRPAPTEHEIDAILIATCAANTIKRENVVKSK